MRYENGTIYVMHGTEKDIRILNNFVKGKYSIQDMERKINILKNEMDDKFDSNYSKPTELYDAICLISKDASVKQVKREYRWESVDELIPTEMTFGKTQCIFTFENFDIVTPMSIDDIKYFFEELRNVNKGYLTADTALQSLRTYCEVTDADEDKFLQDKWDLWKALSCIIKRFKQNDITIRTQDSTAFDIHVWATVDAI